MRLGMLAVTLVLLGAAGAAAGERLLGAPVFDTEAETTYRQITWDDFKSRAQARNLNRWGNWALIVTPLRLGGYAIATRRGDGGGWVAAPVGLRPYAVMDKLLSGASRGGRSKSALAHQQRLFDLAEATARRLAVELRGLTGRGEVPFDAEQDLRYQIGTALARARGELEEVDGRYTAETAGGGSRAAERRWAEDIARMLAEATAALEAALAESESRPSDGPTGASGSPLRP